MSFLMIREKSEFRPGEVGRSEMSVGGINSATAPNELVRGESSSVINFYPTWCQCFTCFMAKKYGRHEQVSCLKRFSNAFLCPPQGTLSRFIFFIFVNSLFCGLMWALDHNLAMACILPLIVLELSGLSCGILLKIVGLPALLAPLLIGIALNNIPGLNFFNGLTNREWIEPIREIALTIILTRAGVELSPKQLKKLQGIVPLAAFTPCLVEACTCGGLFYAFFYEEQVPIALCFVAGFALAAVSPAVVVPGMLTLKKKNYGVKEGIPTLLIAASSIDDVLAISAFSVLLNFVETKPSSSWRDYAGALGIIVGLVHGTIVGIFLHFIPSKDMGRPVPYLRVVIMLLFNLVCMFTYRQPVLHWLSGSGSVGVLTTSFIASFGWRSVPHWKISMKKIENSLAHIWTLCVPMLFGTIGREINVSKFDLKVIGRIVAIICTCLVVRCLTMFLVACCLPKTNKKERLFCALSWIPKATVQAALAPLVISEFGKSPDPKLVHHAENVVLLAVFAIIITAPLGAVLIALLGPIMLRKSVDLPDEYPNGEGNPEDDIQEIQSIKSAINSQDFNAEGEAGIQIDPRFVDSSEPININSPTSNASNQQQHVLFKAPGPSNIPSSVMSGDKKIKKK